jgi:hypothetical protein
VARSRPPASPWRVSNAFGPEYTEADISKGLTAACADDGDEAVTVSLALEWASGDGGTDPTNAALIYWGQ